MVTTMERSDTLRPSALLDRKGGTMTRLTVAALLSCLSVLGATAGSGGHDDDDDGFPSLPARVIATGIPGAGAIAQVGTFHKGGPFNDNAAFRAFTEPGRVLDRTRLFVASTSNFGAPLARPDEAPGAILSIEVGGGGVAVPPDFATAGGQASALDGRVILYAAQSPAFVNGLNNPAAATRDLPAVSLPLGISYNNGFGRPWFANAPTGSAGDGTITVIDPSGVPLAGAPSPVAGGVFAGSVTNRSPASTHGLTAGALATVLLTRSPDLSGRAVFLAALADGSVVQVHVQRGVDGLAPPGSFTPIAGVSTERAESASRHAVTRVGMVFNWVRTRNVFVTDPLADRILVLDLTDDGTLFQATPRYLRSRYLDKPVDVAAAVPEVAARNFASNTTLGGGSDLYVLNRGDNTIVRLTQEGKVVAVRRIKADPPGFRANGLAVSEDARTIWVTATLPGRQGIVLAMPTFGAGLVTPGLIEHARAAGAHGAVAQGADMFAQVLSARQAVGPLFNGRACVSCHDTPSAGGMGASPDSFIQRVARIEEGVFDPLIGEGGPLARAHSIADLGVPCGLPTGMPDRANATSLRSAMTLRGTSLIDNIALDVIQAVQAAQPPAVRGRLNVLADGRPGKFGWKAQTATLVEFMGEALRDEMGLTNPLAPRDLVSGCGASVLKPEADAVPLTALVAFLNTLDPPAPSSECLASAGDTQFRAGGCAACHTPGMPGPGGPVRLYSDLLLHDMGDELADGFEQGSAGGREFRTMPLWRVSDRTHFLHDGRALTILDAILAHGGQAAEARAAFEALGPDARQALLDYLECI
jgi:hypothetical protein